MRVFGYPVSEIRNEPMGKRPLYRRGHPEGKSRPLMICVEFALNNQKGGAVISRLRHKFDLLDEGAACSTTGQQRRQQHAATHARLFALSYRSVVFPQHKSNPH